MSRPLRRAPGLALNVALALGVSLALLSALEIYARHRFQERHARLSNLELEREQARFDPSDMRLVDMIRIAPWRDLVYELRPSLAGRFWGVLYRFNATGMRDRERALEKPPDTFRIALLGDSIGFGWGVPVQLGYARGLERLLRNAVPGRRVEVLNFGVPGYNLAMKAASLERKALAFAPDLILLEYYLNDPFLPNFILEEPEAPALYLLDWMREAAALASQSVRSKGAETQLVRAPYTQNPAQVPPRLHYMIGSAGVERALLRVRAAASAAGIPVAVVVIAMPEGELAGREPDDAFFGPGEQEVAETAQRLGFATINTLAPFLRWVRSSGRSAGDLMRSEHDPHPSALGHRVLARAVAEQLRDSGLLASAGAAPRRAARTPDRSLRTP